MSLSKEGNLLKYILVVEAGGGALFFFFFLAFDEENDSFHLDKMERQVRISCLIHSFSFPPSPPTPPSFSLSQITLWLLPNQL